MKRVILVAAVVVLYVLHQDIWFWRTAHPMLFGTIPVALVYHGCFSLAAALLMWMMVRHAWPGHLEAEIERHEAEGGDGA